ncbi:MAG: ABC transporter permease [Phycisphaeraceae bacterium]|nr:MAG: ABC transporter permease [Phycisphaeraceae bacterium]
MIQTLAIFVDAYRALNARKLFWIALILSGVVVLAFAAVGINEEGLSFFGWQTSLPPNTAIFPAELFYKTMFLTLGVNFWIAWIATILALVTTAGIIPDLVTEGSVDLTLSKPIGRVRLFLTKYISGLLFVALQISVFSAASFLVLGLRGGVWVPAVFIAIPMVILFFSYLFCVCALLGLLTKSTVASLLLTLLFWFAIFGVHTTESILLWTKVSQEQRIIAIQDDIERREQELERMRQGDGRGIGAGVMDAVRLPGRERALERQRERLVEREETARTWRRVHMGAFAVKTVLPKTSETIGLIERWLIDLAELPDMQEPPQPILPEEITEDAEDVEFMDPALQENVTREIQERIRERSVAWIIGTSLVFQAGVLGIACLIFRRRDF